MQQDSGDSSKPGSEPLSHTETLLQATQLPKPAKCQDKKKEKEKSNYCYSSDSNVELVLR